MPGYVIMLHLFSMGSLCRHDEQCSKRQALAKPVAHRQCHPAVEVVTYNGIGRLLESRLVGTAEDRVEVFADFLAFEIRSAPYSTVNNKHK
jgi:hypothetical protein